MRTFLEILGIFFLVILAALVLIIAIIGPELAEYIRIDMGGIWGEEPVPELKGDAARYFELRNVSCGSLSKDFLIVTEDVTEASMEGFLEGVPGERAAAERILAGYSLNQTTKTYVRGDQMKRVVIVDGTENTTIWKDGRIYECMGGCTMRLMNSREAEGYYDNLSKMKTSCAYFGKMPLPETVNLSSLINITRTGLLQIDSHRCDNFLITSNKTYAASLLETEELDEGQRALMWALAHLEGPLQECLDESTGIIVLRNLTLDLTDAYRFDYSPGGYMRVNQQTTLLYFTDDVPQEFLRLPD